jgi:hypothetical protein
MDIHVFFGLDTVTHVCNLSYLGGVNRRITIQGSLGQKKKKKPKKKANAKKIRGMAQVVESLRSKVRS